jgi:hypothetical protein
MDQVVFNEAFCLQMLLAGKIVTLYPLCRYGDSLGWVAREIFLTTG